MIIIKKHYLLLLTVLLLFCSCAETGSSSEPVATSAPDSVISSVQESLAVESSDISEDDSINDEELERLSRVEEKYESTDAFLNSGFIEKNYNDVDFGDDNIIPIHDKKVTDGVVYAHYTNYWIGYEYSGKSYGICINARYNKFDTQTREYTDYKSTEELYNTRCEEKTPGSTHEYDKENDLVIVRVKEPANTFIEKVTPSGKVCDIFCWKENDATEEEIIEFSKHLEF